MLNTSEKEATSLADKIRATLADSRLKKKGSDESIGQVTVSAGVSMLKENDTPISIIDRTDKALYQSKENGHNQVNVGS